jgi:PAS domain S-box-containing protein
LLVKQEWIRYSVLGFMLFSVFLSEIALYQISGGITVVLTHLCYFPVIFLAFRYPRRGALLATGTGILYLIILGLLVYPDPDILPGIMQFYVYASMGVVVSSLAYDMKLNEMKYYTIFDSSANSILLVDVATGRILEANRLSLDQLAGCDEQSAPCSLELLWPDTPARTAFLADLQRDTTVFGREVRLGPHEQASYFLLSAALLADNTAVLSFADISDKKKVEQALRQSERRFRELTELLPLPVFEADAEGRITFANDAAFEKFGYARGDVGQGMSVLDLIVPGDRDRAKENLSQLSEGNRVGIEYTAICRSGQTFPYRRNPRDCCGYHR